MEKFDIHDMEGGWFIGDFLPSAFQTKDFEVCYKVHYKNEKWPEHYHKDAIEINYMIRGAMIVNGRNLKKGDIFVFEKGEICAPTFLSKCELIVVKVPSIPGDKHEVLNDEHI